MRGSLPVTSAIPPSMLKEHTSRDCMGWAAMTGIVTALASAHKNDVVRIFRMVASLTVLFAGESAKSGLAPPSVGGDGQPRLVQPVCPRLRGDERILVSSRAPVRPIASARHAAAPAR